MPLRKIPSLPIADVLSRDGYAAVFGSSWWDDVAGPSAVCLHADSLYDLSAWAFTLSNLLELDIKKQRSDHPQQMLELQGQTYQYAPSDRRMTVQTSSATRRTQCEANPGSEIEKSPIGCHLRAASGS
jgi:fumarylacetoacetate (FAA) hydrolase family protein